MASKREIKAVRRVLYDRKRLREMLGEIRSIDVLMNTNPNLALPADDIRVSAGAGPVWFVLATGEIDPGVLEAARRTKRVAQLLRETRRELKDVDFDPDDRRELRKALDEQAKAMIVRADAWSTKGGDDPRAAAAKINRHDAEALRSYGKVSAYLDKRAFERVS